MDELDERVAGSRARDECLAWTLILAWLADNPDLGCATDREIGGTHTDGTFTTSGCLTCVDPMEQLTRIAADALTDRLGADGAVGYVVEALTARLERLFSIDDGRQTHPFFPPWREMMRYGYEPGRMPGYTEGEVTTYAKVHEPWWNFCTFVADTCQLPNAPRLDTADPQ
jgi:hypothetical protein